VAVRRPRDDAENRQVEPEQGGNVDHGSRASGRRLQAPAVPRRGPLRLGGRSRARRRGGGLCSGRKGGSGGAGRRGGWRRPHRRRRGPGCRRRRRIGPGGGERSLRGSVGGRRRRRAGQGRCREDGGAGHEDGTPSGRRPWRAASSPQRRCARTAHRRRLSLPD
jgi:hypothetical protein